MVNDIISGISIKLDEKFGDDINKYSDGVTQGLTGPCFFILALNPSLKQLVNARYQFDCDFDIHYFPEDASSNTEMNNIAVDLFDVLEYITLIGGDLLRGSNMHYEIVDSVLHFFVSYRMILKTIPAEPDLMMTINSEITLQKG